MGNDPAATTRRGSVDEGPRPPGAFVALGVLGMGEPSG
jgi:hypothetical protein